MIASSSCVRMLARGFVGPIRASDVDSRAFHLAIVLRLTPYRLARAMFFSSLSWIARLTLGVIVARECVCGCAARSCFRATPHLLRIAPQHHHPPKALMRFVRRGAKAHTTGHTGPYRGGSIELGLGGHIDSGKTERLEIAVAQRLLDRRVRHRTRPGNGPGMPSSPIRSTQGRDRPLVSTN